MDLSDPHSGKRSILSCNGCDDRPNGASGASSFVRNFESERNHQIMKATEDLLSSEFGKLSVQERSKALEDLHCVGEELEETEELKEKSLEEFDRLLKQGNYPLYNLAAEQNRAYMEDRTHRLTFLRANDYDARKSVNQLANHLQQKAKLFGEEKLARDITLDDLGSDDLQQLLGGLMHIQDETDRFGRPILFAFSHALEMLKTRSWVSLLVNFG